MRGRVAPWMLLLAACETGGPGGPAPPPSSTAWLTPSSRASVTPRVTKADDVDAIARPRQPDPAALEALVAASPSVVPKPTGPGGETTIGSDTGQPEDDPLPAPGRPPSLRSGPIELEPQVSSPAIERQARAQLYWPLRRCKGPEGRPPPPESITLSFTLREDGSLDPASVTASAVDARLQPTAECVLRVFASTPFEAPPAARRAPARIQITWPSVD